MLMAMALVMITLLLMTSVSSFNWSFVIPFTLSTASSGGVVDGYSGVNLKKKTHQITLHSHASHHAPTCKQSPLVSLVLCYKPNNEVYSHIDDFVRLGCWR